MADKTTSGLTGGSTPLNGEELFYLIQGGASRHVAGSEIVKISHNQAWSTITGTPTTLSGYGITDGATSTQGGKADTALQPGDIGDSVQAQGATLDSLQGLSLASGDVLYATGANALARLAKGTDGQILKLASGLPAWGTVAGTGDMLSTNNLSDLADASTARTNLGLGTAATTDADAYATAEQGTKADSALQDASAFATAAQGGKADTAVQPGDLATVATSGAYSDLSGKPTLVTDASALTYTQGATGSIQRDLIKIIQEAPLNVNDFGAVGDNSTDNATAFAAVQAALGANGGEIFVPYGQYRTSGPLLNLIGGKGIKVRGLGSVIGLTSPYPSCLIYTGSTGNLINLDGTTGVEICGLDLAYTALASSGTFGLIDLTKKSGSQYTSGIDIHHCRIGGVGSTFNLANPGAFALVNVSNTLMASIRYCFLQNASNGIRGASSGAVSNKIDLIGNWFNYHLTNPIYGGGNGWNIKDNISEPPHYTDNANAGFLGVSNLNMQGLNFSGNQLDDAGTSGYWVLCSDGSIKGGSITGNFFQGGSGHVDINLGSSQGVLIAGNFFQNGEIVGGSAKDCLIMGNYNSAGSDLFGGTSANYPIGHSFIDVIGTGLKSKGSLGTY